MKKIDLDYFSMYVDPRDSGVCRNLVKRAGRLERGEDPGYEREPAFTWIVREKAGEVCGSVENPLFLDLGANVGLFTLIMDYECKQRALNYWIQSVEPDRDNFSVLSKNMHLNDVKGEAIFCAISDFSGMGKFHRSSYSNLGALIPHGKTDRGSEQVQVYTLPDFLQVIGGSGVHPSFIKMDVEGSEVEILRGAREFLSGLREPCSILMEVHPMFYDTKRSLETELEFLFGNGWRCEYMVSAAVLRPDKFVEAGLEPCKEFPSRGHSRAIYSRETYKKSSSKWHELVLDFACHSHTQKVPGKKASPKIVRSILIERN